MTRYNAISILIAYFICCYIGQAQCNSAAKKPVTSAARLDAAASNQRSQTKTSSVATDAPVITIDGLCEEARVNKDAGSNCKTVITRAQFERVVAAIQPGMRNGARREFALNYVSFLMMTKRAEEMGLDKGANYEEQMKIARIQVLSKALNKAIEEEASQISDRDIESYYRDNAAGFETADMERIYVPKAAQFPYAEGTTPGEAESLYARAVAGEDFSKLQTEAYQLAGIKSATSNTSLKLRRVSLPPNQASVMDLKPGQFSSILTDPNGYVIYRLKTKEMLPLDEVREEIKATLRSARMKRALHDIQDSLTPVLNESYFAH